MEDKTKYECIGYKHAIIEAVNNMADRGDIDYIRKIYTLISCHEKKVKGEMK